MLKRNGSFIAGYMAGRNDRTHIRPFNNSRFENLIPEYKKGYKAGYEGKGSVVIEMPDEIVLCEGCGGKLGLDKIFLPEDPKIAMCPACAKKDDTESYARLSVGDRVRRRDHNPNNSGVKLGTINSIVTECGPEYISVRWDSEDPGFCEQVPKEFLIKVD